MLDALKITRDQRLPKLGWYASYDPVAETCEVEIGSFVEIDPSTSPRWVVAGFWSGDFAAGDFHRSEHAFGSGLRLDDDGLHVVPASTSIDRCVYARDATRWHLSNSLMVLLGRLGARLEPQVDHSIWSESPCCGILHYVRQIPVVHPFVSTVNQLMFESMRLSPRSEQAFFFRDRPHSFAGYADYVMQLEGELRLLWANATDERRARKMRAVTTASRGYDSPAATALVARLVPGVISWTARRSNTRIPAALRGLMKVDVVNDDGSEIARRLGADPRYLELDLSSMSAEMEAWCWASAQISPELIFHSLLVEADGQEVPTVWFAGHAGDRVWGRSRDLVERASHLIRQAPSGFALVEARLRHGLIDCSVPYLFARSMKSINAITNAPEMAPWQLDNDYDRPIPRRILEERGIPRDWFGFGKKAVAQDFESPQGEALRKIFFERSGWTPAGERLYRGLNFGLYFAHRTVDFARLHGDREKLLDSGHRNDKRTLAQVLDLQRQTFLLCTELVSGHFAKPGAATLEDARPAPFSGAARSGAAPPAASAPGSPQTSDRGPGSAATAGGAPARA